MSGPGRSSPAAARIEGKPFALLALTALIAFHLRGVITGGALFVRDINMVWLPQVESFVRCVAEGSWPLWDRYPAFGRPLLADPRSQVLYPPAWLNLVLAPETAYAAMAVLHILIGGIGVIRLGQAWGLSAPAALVAAALWITSGPLLSLVSMWHHLAGAAWMPWVLLAVHSLLAAPGRVRAVVAAAAIAVQVLSGSPDYVALTLLAVITVTLSSRGASPWRGRPQLVAVAGAAALALGLSAIQWWPTLEVVLRSARRLQSDAAATTWSLHPALLPEMVAPMRWADLPLTADAVGELLEWKEPWLRSIYLGTMATLLAAAGLGAGHLRSRGLAVMGGVMLLLSLGAHGPLAGVLSAAPGIRSLRYPVKALVPCALAWALLAGIGFDALRRTSPRARRAALAGAFVAILVPGVALVALEMQLVPWVSDRIGSAPLAVTVRPLAVAFVLAVFGGLAVVKPTALGGAAAAAGAIGVLAVGELAVRHQDLNPVADRLLFRHRPQALRLIDRSEEGRTYAYDYSMGDGRKRTARTIWPYEVARLPRGSSPAEGLVLGVHQYLNPPTAARWQVFGSYDLDILGFDPPALASLASGLRDAEDSGAHLRLLQIGAVRNVLALVPAPWWRDLQLEGTIEGLFRRPIQVFRVPDPLPRAFVVDGIRVADGEAALALLRDATLPFRTEVILPFGSPRAGLPGAGRARVAARTCDSVTVEVEASRDAHVVLVDAHDPGWKARVDGTDARVERANVGFQAVPVSAGRHTVHLRYRPAGFVTALLASVMTLAIALVAVLRRRTEGRPTLEARPREGS